MFKVIVHVVCRVRSKIQSLEEFSNTIVVNSLRPGIYVPEEYIDAESTK